MRARFRATKKSRVLFLPLVTLAVTLLASCGGGGSAFYVDSPREDSSNSNSSNTIADRIQYTEYTAGAIPDYPLQQVPATGPASITWLIAEINGSQAPQDVVERIEATNSAFSHYALEQSRGAFDLANISISPALQIDTAEGELPSIAELQQLTKAAADAEAFQYDDRYVAYLIIADDFDGITASTSDEQSGTITVDGEFDIAMTVHEMFHMLSIGRADAMEGSTTSFPGENIEDADPYFFMGSEGSAKDCLNEAAPCEIHATLSIPHKGRAGWLDSSEVIVSNNTGVDKVFRLFNHDNFQRTELQPLTVYLTGYDPHGLFAVSYLTNARSNRITSNGVMVHYVPYDAPANSHLVDLTPGSITINDEQPNDPAFTSLHDFGDAAIAEATVINIADLFAIEVLATGANDNGDHWADIKVIPSSCIYPPREFDTDDFLDQTVSTTEEYCETNYSYHWGVKAARTGEVAKTDLSLEYRDLDLTGGSLQLTVNEGVAESLGLNRPLSATYSDGDTLWISYLMAPRKISDGHMFVYPGSVVEAGIGKQWGEQFAIGNASALAPAFPVANEVSWLVGKYELSEGADTITLWVNPETGILPEPSTAYMARNDIDVGDINSISINLNHIGSGEYDIDRIYTGTEYSDISNVTASSTAAPLFALHYDLSPDLDDLQAIAAGANLSEKFGIEPAVVIGTYGVDGQFAFGAHEPQSLADLYNIDTNTTGPWANNGESRREKGRQVADAAYGEGEYLDTGDGWEAAVNAQAGKFWESLRGGQEVLVADGGPMDFTADVLTRLQSHYGASEAELKLVTVVQHALGFNVSNTRPGNMEKIQGLATYVTIDNGNSGGNNTADLEDSSINTTTSDFADWARNNNSHSDAWNSALDDFSAKIDFSDTVEYLHILDVPLDLVSDIDTFRQLFE